MKKGPLFCTEAEKTYKTYFACRNAKAKVRVRSNEFLVHRGGDIVEIVVADIL